MRTRVTVIMLLCLAALVSGCIRVELGGETKDAKPSSGQKAATETAAPADTPSASLPATARPLQTGPEVVVPDVFKAVREHTFSSSYEKDPEAVANELKGFVTGVLEGAGLKADVRLQSVEAPESQDPPAGTVVDPGTTVTVRMGFGD